MSASSLPFCECSWVNALRGPNVKQLCRHRQPPIQFWIALWGQQNLEKVKLHPTILGPAPFDRLIVEMAEGALLHKLLTLSIFGRALSSFTSVSCLRIHTESCQKQKKIQRLADSFFD